MDPPLVNESSFSVANPSSYSLTEIWPYPISNGGSGDVGLRMENMNHGLGDSSGLRDGSLEESTVTEHSGGGCGRKRRDLNLSSQDESSKIASSSSSANDLERNGSNGKWMKMSGLKNEKSSKTEVEASSVADGNNPAESSKPSEPRKDYIHVRARRGQATDSHSLAERARREKISERMKILQDLVPGCNKVLGKALVLDEIINYIESLRRQVEFLSMKLETVNSRVTFTPTTGGFHPKDAFGVTGTLFGSQAAREFADGSELDWLHMQVGGSLKQEHIFR